MQINLKFYYLISTAIHHYFMTAFNELITDKNILLDVDASNKKRVFEQAGILFENEFGIARATITDNLLARESLGSTGLGQGVAIPHGRIKGLKKSCAALLRLKNPIAFDAPDNELVSIFIIFLVPEKARQRHLDTLSQIAELLSDKPIREALKQASSANEIDNLLKQWQSNHHLDCSKNVLK